MAGYILLGFLAAFGALSALWAIFGWLLPANRKGLLIYVGDETGFFVRRYLWLRGLGLISCPLILTEPVNCDRDILLTQEIEICSPEELALRLGIGAKDFDAGIGNYSRCHQHGGISEL